jgi:hypothetical protein
MKTRPSTRTPARKKTHFVPKVVYRTAFVGVVPVCVAGAACGGGSSSGDAGMNLSVACSSFCGVAQQAFTDAGDAPLVPSDATSDGADADSATDSSCFCCPPNFCGVALIGFADAGNDG